MKIAVVTGALFLITAGHALAGPGAGEPKESADPTSGRPGAILDDAKCASVWSLTERDGDKLSEAKAAPFVINTQFVTSVPADALSISTYYNEDVYDNQDNKIGDVNDILLDKDGRVSTVIIGVGGFLGVGEKDVAVPFSALKVADKEGDRYLVINATKEALEKAPGYMYDKDKGVWVPVTKQE